MDNLAMATGQDPGWVYLAVFGCLAVAVLFSRVWKHLEQSGKVRRGQSADRAGNAMLELESLFQPGKRHVIEAKGQKKSEQTNGGDK